MSFTPVLAPLPRGILATCTAPHGRRRPRRSSRPTRRPTPTSRSCTCCPRASWPSTAATLGANTVHLQVTVDADARRLVAVAAIDNLTKGTAGGAVQCMNLALGLPETTGPAADGSRAVTRHDAPEGFRAAGVAAGLKASGAPRPRPRRQRRPGARRRRACSPRNQVKAAPVLWSQQVLTGGRAARRRPQLRRRQRVHRARGLPDHARHRREGGRGAGLRRRSRSRSAPPASSASSCPRDAAARRGREGRRRRSAADAEAAHAAATASDHRHRRQAGRHAAGAGLDASAASPRAPA